MTWYKLKCATCNEDFQPLRSNAPGELSAPADEDDEEQTRTGGGGNIWSLRKFQERHQGHELVEVPEESNYEHSR